MVIKLLLMGIITLVKQGTLRTKVNIGIMAGTTITHITMDLTAVFIIGTVTIGMLGDLTTEVADTGLTTLHTVIKNQTDTIPTTSPMVMDITILWFIMVPLVGMMVMCTPTLVCHTIATHMHITHTQALITTTITTQQHTLTLMLLHTTQVAQEEQEEQEHLPLQVQQVRQVQQVPQEVLVQMAVAVAVVLYL
jgi:hypothetical protein